MFEMLYAKSLHICLPFLFLAFNIKQPFSLLPFCLRTEEQHLLETKDRVWQQGASPKRAETDNRLLSGAHMKRGASYNEGNVLILERRRNLLPAFSGTAKTDQVLYFLSFLFNFHALSFL